MNIEVGGTTVELKLRALHVPSAQCRLLCPQQLVKEHKPKVATNPTIGEEAITIEFAEGVVECFYNQSNLPMVRLSSTADLKANFATLQAMILEDNNQNLTAAQKELLRWHFKLGHLDLRRCQRLLKSGAMGDSPLVKAAGNLDLQRQPLMCGSCAFGKAKKKTSRTKWDKSVSAQPKPPVKMEKLLSKEVLIPGQKVSMDHFVVSTPGRLFNSRGIDRHDRMFKGGVIFVDHATGFVFVEPVVNFTAGEALRAKREFEKEMGSMGVTVLNYHSDNGVFTATEFQDQLAKMGQGLSLSGVGAHHQNAMAERAIGTVMSMARIMMLHAKIRWPQATSTKLWPMAVKHAQHLVNHVPNLNNVCPLDLVL